MPSGSTSDLLLPPSRLQRWLDNFAARHGPGSLTVRDGHLHGVAEDRSSFTARLPFGAAYDGLALVDPFVAACTPPPAWGLLLVRKGGFAVARMAGSTVADSKVGKRHVQGRSKAGGQSQQRFARRRENQAREAYSAAAEHASRILAPLESVVHAATEPSAVVLVTGGDREAVAAVLADRRLARLAGHVVAPFLAVPDPRRAVLDAATIDAGSVRMSVTNT